MAPPGSAHMNFSLGGVVILGGAIGYLKKGSTASLAAGLTFGGLLIGSGVLITRGESFQGHALATGVTGTMAVAMGQRFLSSGKFMPAGMVASMAAVGLAYNAKKALEWMPSKDVSFLLQTIFFASSFGVSQTRLAKIYKLRDWLLFDDKDFLDPTYSWKLPTKTGGVILRYRSCYSKQQKK